MEFARLYELYIFLLNLLVFCLFKIYFVDSKIKMHIVSCRLHGCKSEFIKISISLL